MITGYDAIFSHDFSAEEVKNEVLEYFKAKWPQASTEEDDGDLFIYKDIVVREKVDRDGVTEDDVFVHVISGKAQFTVVFPKHDDFAKRAEKDIRDNIVGRPHCDVCGRMARYENVTVGKKPQAWCQEHYVEAPQPCCCICGEPSNTQFLMPGDHPFSPSGPRCCEKHEIEAKRMRDNMVEGREPWADIPPEWDKHFKLLVDAYRAERILAEEDEVGLENGDGKGH